MSVFDRVMDSLVAIAAAPLFAPSPAPSRPRTAFGWTGTPPVRRVDSAFAVAAMEIGMIVTALSRVAAERASGPAVRDFAQTLIAEHTAANAELAKLAADKKLTLPLAAGGPARTQAEELEVMLGDALDTAYLRRVVEEHERAASLFATAQESGGDAELAGFAASRLPVIESHLKLARDLVEHKSSRKGHKSHHKGD